MNGKHLVSLDTDKIKSYIFATPNLKEIRGASALLDWLNRVKTPEVIEKYGGSGSIIYAHGGSAAATFPDEKKAEGFIREIEGLYRQVTITGSITGEMIKLDEEKKDGFRLAFDQLGYLLRMAKDSGHKSYEQAKNLPSVYPVISSPFIRFCDACGIYPAIRKQEQENDFLCEACLKKRGMNEEVRGKRHISNYTSPIDEFIDYVKDKSEWKTFGDIYALLPESFDDIGNVYKNYLGFIYCDGNSFGQILKGLPDRAAYQSFATELNQTLREVTFGALAEHLKPRRVKSQAQKEVLPFEIIMLGGDDLILVTAADKALEVATEIVSKFEERAEANEQLNSSQKLTLSAGVVIAHAAYPITAIYKMAENLCKSAKSDYEKIKTGTIDYMVIRESACNPLDEIRRKELYYRTKEGKENMFLTQRPFRATELDNLLKHTRKIKEAGIAHSKLQSMYESLFTSKINAQYGFMDSYIKLRKTSQVNQKEILLKFFQEFGIKMDSPPPWRKEKEGNNFTTPLLDLIEIYSFVQAGKEATQ